ncbi:MAG: hypothetical protein BWY78_00850 [Alphaproteobacteria bacterium ADurb.Bin438]|nr:MAG: hypothetical protein BWY78_00850 [Alphaproteobacteria bacterium ADurb.Bin438]
MAIGTLVKNFSLGKEVTVLQGGLPYDEDEE